MAGSPPSGAVTLQIVVVRPTKGMREAWKAGDLRGQQGAAGDDQRQTEQHPITATTRRPPGWRLPPVR